MLLLMFFLYIAVPSFADTYTVKSGDSLWKISKAHKIATSDIRKLNDIYGEYVFENQKLFIPSSIVDYTVKNGDSFQSIATQFGTDIKYIITLNNLSENHVIEGQKLRIPQTQNRKVISTNIVTNIVENPTIAPVTPASVVKTDPIIYKVKKGDTLSDVALKHKTTVPKLQELNNKTSSTIYVGENLIVGNKVVPTPTTNVPTKHKITYTVKTGDTLGQIAINHKVSSKDIMTWNNKKSSTIYKNEKLTIYVEAPATTKTPVAPSTSPTTSTTIPPGYKTIKYTVQRGENLSYIVAKFGTTISVVKKLNNKKSDKILVGEILNIPVKETENLEHSLENRTAQTKLVRYKVKKGDTLDGIAIKHKVTRSQMLSWNNKRSTTIYIGESLKIYVPTTTTTSSPAPASSKKAEYIKRTSGTGINSRSFNNISLPVKYNDIVSATTSGRGVDLTLNKKMTINSPSDATIQYAGYIKALQNVVILELSNNRTIVYAGLDRLNVTNGQTVSANYLLGTTGISSTDKQSKLYIEMRENNKVVNVLTTYKELTKKQKK